MKACWLSWRKPFCRKQIQPGAKNLSAHLFALKMVDDCYSKSNQDKYIQGMKDFESFVTKKTGKSFTEDNSSERQSIVSELDQQKSSGDDCHSFISPQKD